MLQGIMQKGASESERDDDGEGNEEDEARKPATSDKQKRSSRDKEMMIMKHVNISPEREVPRQGQSEQGEDRESTAAVQCEKSQWKAPASPESSKNRCRWLRQKDGMAI